MSDMDSVTLAETLRLHGMWWRGESGGRRANLRHANLSHANLRHANLRDANLSDANLSGANLRHANLRHADLRDADLSGADLSDANLSGADLSDANLSDANLSGANLSGADLSDANLSGANLRGVLGNMGEVKSAQFDKWPITWTQSPDGVMTLQIGCQRHDLDLWRKSDRRWIAAMDPGAVEWWERYRDVVLTLVDASPAVPYGNAALAQEAAQ